MGEDYEYLEKQEQEMAEKVGSPKGKADNTAAPPDEKKPPISRASTLHNQNSVDSGDLSSEEDEDGEDEEDDAEQEIMPTLDEGTINKMKTN